MSPMRLLLVILFFVAACAHGPVSNSRSPEALRKQMKLSGQGKARLEIGQESWVFGFESAYVSATRWAMGLRIPLQGEFSFDFPDLDQAAPTGRPGADDFRWRVTAALEQESRRRKLGYPEVGQDFMSRLHQLLRMISPAAPVPLECVERGVDAWKCRAEGADTEWRWSALKSELVLESALREKWLMRTTFKIPSEQGFQRVTLEVVRRTADAESVELRQELFFSTH